MNEILENYWWDYTNPENFFRFYKDGDNSFDGPYPGLPMNRDTRTISEVDSILRLTNLTKNQILLDTPCGWGRHCLELGKRGYRVIGIDLNKDFIAQGIAEINKNELSENLIEFKIGDMREIPIADRAIDVGINMFTSFGFFASELENIQVAKEFFRVLKTGGQLVIHQDYNPDSVINGSWKGKETRHRNLPSNRTLLIDETFDEKSRRIFGSWTITNPDDTEPPSEEKSYSWRVYSSQEMKEMLLECGFEEVEFLSKRDGKFQQMGKNQSETFILAKK